MNIQKNQVPEDMEKLKEIPKWTRKYTQNRTVPVLIALVINLCLFAGIAIPSYFGGRAYRSENMVLFWIFNFALVVAMISLGYFCVPKWGGKFIERLSKRFYDGEGDVSISVPETIKKKKWIGYVVAMVFGSCVLISVGLGFIGYLPIKYMQPISALYGVPFLVFLYFWQRPAIGPLALLWPVLYTIHAILIVAGTPIFSTINSPPLNMILPIFGYGFLTHAIGHVYSRYALKNLKGITHLEKGTVSEG